MYHIARDLFGALETALYIVGDRGKSAGRDRTGGGSQLTKEVML